MAFRSPSEPPPPVRHRRHASMSRLTLGPASLDELRAREDLHVRASSMLGEWLRQRATTTTAPPVVPSQTEAAPVDTANPSAPEVASKPPAERFSASEAPHASVPLPSSDDEEMDLTSSRKRARETESDDDEATARRKQPPYAPPSAEQHVEASGHVEQAGQGGAILPPCRDAAATLSSPAAQAGAPPETASASASAARVNATDAMELADAPPAGSSKQGPEHPAARFLKDPPRQPAPLPKRKGKKHRKHNKAPAVASSSSPVARPPALSPPAYLQQLRRAKALETAALPVDPAVIGTVLFRPSAPGGAFRGAPRLALAAALSSRAGVAAVRVNHRRNIVAADTTTRECQEELLAITELHGISVTARLPAVRGQSTGYLHGVTGLPADADLLGAMESSVPVLSATRDGSTITVRFAGPVPPEHLSLFKLGFRVRPARPRPVQCRQCGRFGHVLESCSWSSDCISCGKSHAEGEPCRTVRCRNCGGLHRADTPACPKWQEERQVATIMASSTAALSRRAVRAAVREEQQQQSSTLARSYASALKGPSTAPKRPVPAPRTSRRQEARDSAAPPGQATVDQLVANLLVTMQWPYNSHRTIMASPTADCRPRILQWNCNSLRRRHAELAEQLPLHDYDVLAFQETYARAEEVSLPGYIGYSSPTECRRDDCDAAPCTDAAHPPGSPRAAVYVRVSLPHALIATEHLCCAVVECVAVTVRVRGTDTSVASVYVRPALQCDMTFLSRLAASLARDCVVCGDFNAHHGCWGSAKTTIRGKNLMGAAGAAGLAVINSGQPTFARRSGTATVIDLALVSERCSYEWQRAPDTAGSDHFPISLSPVRPNRGATRVYTVVRWPMFRDFCAQTPRGDDFFAHIADCAHWASTRVAVPAGSPCPDIKFLNVRAARCRAQRRAMRTGAEADWTLYNRLDAPCNERRGWRVLRALLNPKTPRFPVLAIAIARGISELELAELLANAFAATPPASSAPPAVLQALYAAVFVRGEAHTNHAQAITSLCESDFTHHELRRALSRGRRRRSAPGADGITLQMLRNLDEPQRRLLLDAYNDVLHSGSLPDSWRHAVIVPVLKRGKPPHSPASYRPISLTSIPGKTMEAMALSRLQWIADARGALPPEQCGFRARRSTADCIAIVAGTLEQARLDRETAFLLLLDVQSAFDCLPHDTILSAVRALRTSAVRVGGTVGSPRPVSCGVPQGSVLSPFLFNLALAPIIECIPKTGRFPVRAVLYADDIALLVHGPTSATVEMRFRLQEVLDGVANFLRAIGLRLSSTKSEAILIRPCGVRRRTGCVLVDGVPLPWRLTVRYLGLTIDNRLTWFAAVRRLRAEMRRVESAVRGLLARGDGCPASFAAALYSAVALPKVLYALPLCRVSARLWKLIDSDHRRVLRMCHGLPRSSRVAETLAETGAWPVSLTADLRALGHLERFSSAPDAGPILSVIRCLPQSRVGTVCELFDSLVVDPPPVPPIWPPPHQRTPLHVCLDLPGVRSKHRTPLCAVQQEAAARIEDDLGGMTHLYADGSVLSDGSAAAACVAPALGITKQCRLYYRASSTTAELAGLHLAADILEESPHITSAAILCDSRSALQQLLLDERAPPLAQRVAVRLHALQGRCNLRLQWIPAHVGVAGNETADRLARRAHDSSTALTDRVSSLDTARLHFRRELALHHPDDRVAQGPFHGYQPSQQIQRSRTPATTLSAPNARQRGRPPPPTRKRPLPRLPSDDLKIVLRPQGTLNLHTVGPARLAVAIYAAANVDQRLAVTTDQVRIHPTNNTVIVSTPDSARAVSYAKVRAITIDTTEVAVAAYAPAPDNSVRGILYRAYSYESDA
ncbi:uncharacterized protein [Dermacentor albipictus]|uniref:uncharacterized protein n=1 Tax=Dermacentor albipictus TaxID=60249 RepID=UPI0038FC0800